MRRTRTLAAVTCIVIAAGSMITIAPAGAVKPWDGTIRCGQFRSSWSPPNPVPLWQLSGCNHRLVTGGAGTPVQTSSTPAGTTLVINWSAGMTTTIFLNSQITPTSSRRCRFRSGGGPHEIQEAYLQPGSVIADSTGFIKSLDFTVSICFESNNLVPASSTWNSTPFIF